MKNTEMITVANKLIAAANLPENVEIRVLESTGNRIMLRSFIYNRATSPILGNLTTVSQIGYGLTLWGILGADRIRTRIADYIAKVGC